MKLTEKNGILYPAKMKFSSWIVAGPPGSGKSYLMKKIGGYPGEICIDISEKKWWTVEPLTHRPREIHFALPFHGYAETHSVYDENFKGIQELPELEFERIRIPQKKKFILAPNWQARFVFDFILPPPGWLFATRKSRLSSGDMRLVDMDLTPEWIAWQIHTYWKIAWFFYQSGLQVMLRPFNTARPYSFPVLDKILQKKGRRSDIGVVPSMDWSKVEVVKQWFDQASPKQWKIQQWNEDEK